MKYRAMVFLLVLLAAVPAQAQQSLKIQLQMTPEMQKQAEAYDKAAAGLSPRQKEVLESVIKQGVAETVRVKLADLSMNRENMAACAKLMHGAEKQDLQRAYLDYESYVQAQIEAGRYRVQQAIGKIDFMDGRMVRDAVHRQDMMTVGMAQAMQKLAIRDGLKAEDICGALPGIFEKEFAPLPGAEAVRPATQEVDFSMMELGGRQCHMGFRIALEDGRTISATSLYRFDRAQKAGDFSFSFKFYAADGAQLPLRSAWVSYGGVDSRAINYSMTEDSALLLGILPDGAVQAMMGRLRKQPLRFAVQDGDGAVHGYSLKMGAEKLDGMASCVALVDGGKAEKLRQAGFRIAAGTAAAGQETAKGAVYKLWEGQAGATPLPLCVTHNVQQAADGSGEYGLMLVFSALESTAAQKAPAVTGLWVSGVDKNRGKPLSIQQARVTMEAHGERAAFDSAQAGTVSATGAFYKIDLGRKAFGRFFDSLRQSPARVDVDGTAVTFPAIPEEDAAIFGACVKNMMARAQE